MIKRIVIYFVIYVILLLTIIFTLSEMETAYLLAIVISGLAFGVLIVIEVYKKYFVGSKPKNYDLEYGNTNLENLSKISRKPFLFGLEKKIISEDDFYFDDQYFYIVNKANQTAKFSLNDITELSRTPIKINNSSIWQVKINDKNEELIFKFAHNYSIWNKGFLQFYEKVKILNPSAIK